MDGVLGIDEALTLDGRAAIVTGAGNGLGRAESAALARGAAATKAAKPRKLSFKEQRELEGMEAQIHATEAEIARIEGLFADAEFFRKYAAQVNQLTDELELAKQNVTKYYARWEELEALKAASGK